MLKKLFKSRNDRLVAEYQKAVRKANDLEKDLIDLSDIKLKLKAEEVQSKLSKTKKLTPQHIAELFAIIREASKRTLGMRHFDVQLIGGMTLFQGKMAEMKTGEGKTLVIPLAVILAAFEGKSTHVVTVNEYLASRDAAHLRPLYEFMGLTVGVISANMQTLEKQQAYACDVVYGVNHEFGFDYLRDNMVKDKSEKVQVRGLQFAIVDEADSILIDEARTPLIISGEADEDVSIYPLMHDIIRQLTPDLHYTFEEKERRVMPTEAGYDRIEEMLVEVGVLQHTSHLYTAENLVLLKYIQAALNANVMYHLNQHYVVKDGEVVIVDENTGRLMTGRRWSDGLHQAVEAKEKVRVNKDSQTMASITYQNLFRMYEHLAGLTGTAYTEAEELFSVYGLETVVIPTNNPMVRIDAEDKIYFTEQEKLEAILADVKSCYDREQPVLIGTESVEWSEKISSLLSRANLPHNVLNAKNHEQEAKIIADAGLPKAITVATNMAGRGTDIILGGHKSYHLNEFRRENELDPNLEELVKTEEANWKIRHEKVLECGGLRVIGTCRHDSRRVDDQLRGRAGRQGDKGSSQFYLSLDDTLLRIFGGDKIKSMLGNMAEKGEAIEHPWISKAVRNAQKKVEGMNYDSRKQLMEYDSVISEQRQAVYSLRDEILNGEDLVGHASYMVEEEIERLLDDTIPMSAMDDEWKMDMLQSVLLSEFHLDLPLGEWFDEDLDAKEIRLKIHEAVRTKYLEITSENEELTEWVTRQVLLQALDHWWREHLHSMDELREGIHLRSYAQKDPKREYKLEAFKLFEVMRGSMIQDVARFVMSPHLYQMQTQEEPEPSSQPVYSNMQISYGVSEVSEETIRSWGKVSRNAPCPCGSGQRFKECHGKLS